MEFGILGPLTVYDAGPVAIPRGKPTAVLLVLLLHRNEVVSAERLIDEVWGETAPRTAHKTVQLYVSQLRKVLPSGMLATQPGSGYILHVSDEEIDAGRFERCLADGRDQLEQGEAAEAAETLRAALALWRGNALAEVAYEDFARAESERLSELRLEALEARIEADLALGRHTAVAGELERLSKEHPLREHLLALLMLALYRCGRQADALKAYRTGRRRLLELGIEPSSEVRSLEQQILRQDPALAAPPRRRLGVAVTSRRTRISLAGVAAVVVAAVAAGLVFGLGSGSGRRLADANSVALVGPNGHITTELPVGDSPAHATVGGGFLWTSNERDGTVSRVDRTSRSSDTIVVGRSPEGLAFADGHLWVALGGEGRVAVVDPRAGKVVGRVHVGSSPTGLAARGHELWVANSVDGTLTTIDTRSWRRLRTVGVGPQPSAVAATDDAVWVSLAGSGAVAELDPNGRSVVQPVPVGNDPTAIAVAGDRVWVANAQDGTVSRIDPAQDRVDTTLPVGGAPLSLTAGRDVIWVAVAGGRLEQIDARSAHSIRTYTVGGEPAAVAADGSGTWVATLAPAASHRGGSLRVAIDDDVFACRCVEPLEGLPGAGWQLLDLVYDGLVAYRRAGGPAGGLLVPDLARALPRPTHGGRTYGFRLRPGVRFSNGRTVRPSDVRASLERSFEVENDYVVPLFTHIVGAASCSVGHPCDLSRGIVADDRAGTVTFHLGSPDPDFLYELALPPAFVVPADTRTTSPKEPPAGTGPYRIATSVSSSEHRRHPGRLVLIRSSRFRVFAPEATPDGFPDRIVVTTMLDTASQVAAVERRKADVASQLHGLGSRVAARLASHHASQLHIDSVGATEFFFLNTRVPPFDRLAARRAVNEAVDRSLLVRQLGGRAVAQPTCQILPQGFPGYRPYCPYGLTPSPAGNWTGPNLMRARRLVAESGTKGMDVTVWAPPHHAALAGYFAGLLRRLGYKAATRVVPGEKGSATPYYEAVGNPKTRAQIGPVGWIQDYTSPADFIRTLFDCSSVVPSDLLATYNDSEFCSQALERQIHAAERLQEQDPTAGQQAWAAADRLIVDKAGAVPYANDLAFTLVSPRTGNYQSSPQWGVLLDQLWVR